MGSYRHLTRDDRDEIAVLKAAGWSQRRIAEAVGKSPSTISRELRRNALDCGRYSAHVADGAYMMRRQRCAVLEQDKRLAGFVRDRLTEAWSPQQISGWLRSGAELGLRAVAAETIYAATSAGAPPQPGRPATRSGTGFPSTRGPRASMTARSRATGKATW